MEMEKKMQWTLRRSQPFGDEESLAATAPRPNLDNTLRRDGWPNAQRRMQRDEQ